MQYIKILPDGKPQIKPKEALSDMLNNKIPDATQNLSELFKEFDQTIKGLNSDINVGALNKVHGDWYEWILAIEFWNYRIRIQ